MDLDSFEEDVLKDISNSNLDSALNKIIEFVQTLFNDPSTTAFLFGSRKLDGLCSKIGESSTRMFNINPLKINEPKTTVILASSLGQFGGHTLVVEDIIKSQSDRKHILILTDLFNDVDRDFVEQRFSSLAEVRIAPSDSSLLKLKWLMCELEKLGSEQVFLFNHHQDAIIISGVQPFIGTSRVMFYHHGDHHLSLGVHLRGADHIDPHNLGFFNCRTNEGIRDNYYLPLAVEDKGIRLDGSTFLNDESLISCSSGTSNKFLQEYSYTYSDLIVKRLSLRSGVHIHIGDIPPDFYKAIFLALKKAEIQESRFIHIKWVKSLWLTLSEFKVDLYIGSFPVGGGRAAIEAMGSGTPLLMHQNGFSRFYSGIDLIHDDVLTWANFEEFERIISTISREDLIRASSNARNWYESNYRPELIAIYLKLILEKNHEISPPPIKEFNQDFLKFYFQIRKEVTKPVIDQYEKRIAEIKENHFRELRRIYDSKSWKLTIPLRWIFAKLSSIFKPI